MRQGLVAAASSFVVLFVLMLWGRLKFKLAERVCGCCTVDAEPQPDWQDEEAQPPQQQEQQRQATAAAPLPGTGPATALSGP